MAAVADAESQEPPTNPTAVEVKRSMSPESDGPGRRIRAWLCSFVWWCNDHHLETVMLKSAINARNALSAVCW